MIVHFSTFVPPPGSCADMEIPHGLNPHKKGVERGNIKMLRRGSEGGRARARGEVAFVERGGVVVGGSASVGVGSLGARAGRVFASQGSATMVQPKQGLLLLKFIPKAMRPSTSDVSSVALWGTTAALGALWLVQPFDWIKAQVSGAPAEEEQK